MKTVQDQEVDELTVLVVVTRLRRESEPGFVSSESSLSLLPEISGGSAAPDVTEVG